MASEWTLQLIPSGSIYCTVDVKHPVENGELRFTLVKKETPLPAQGQIAYTPDGGRRGAVIYLESLWDSDVDRLCTPEEAGNAVAGAACGGSPWEVTWMPEQRQWAVVPEPEDVQGGFTAVITLTKLVSTAVEGPATLLARPRNIPGLVRDFPYSCVVQKLCPMRLVRWELSRDFAERGENAEVRWQVENAALCWLNDEEKNTEGALQVTVEGTRRFVLEAQDPARKLLKPPPLTLGLTNWKNLGAASGLPAGEEDSPNDRRLHRHGGKTYLFRGGGLYESGDEGLSWAAVGAKAPEVPADYTAAVHGDDFWLLGKDRYCRYSFPQGSWSAGDLPVASQGLCQGASFGKRLCFLAGFGGRFVSVFSCRPGEVRWNLSTSFTIDSLAGLEMEQMDCLVYRGSIYLGVLDKKTRRVAVWRSSDGSGWNEYFVTREEVSGWFRLLEGGGGPLLLWENAVLDLGAGGRALENFLPACLAQTHLPPWVGSWDQEGLVLARSDGGEAGEELWRCRG